MSDPDDLVMREFVIRDYNPDAKGPGNQHQQRFSVYLSRKETAELDAACEALEESRYSYARRAVLRALRGGA